MVEQWKILRILSFLPTRRASTKGIWLYISHEWSVPIEETNICLKKKVENNNRTNRTEEKKIDCYLHLSLCKLCTAQLRVTKNSVWECINAKICLCVCVCVDTVSKSRSYVGVNQQGLNYSIHTSEYHNFILNCAILCKCKSVHTYILLKLKSIIKNCQKSGSMSQLWCI